jgi:hypothetical protein
MFFFSIFKITLFSSIIMVNYSLFNSFQNKGRSVMILMFPCRINLIFMLFLVVYTTEFTNLIQHSVGIQIQMHGLKYSYMYPYVTMIIWQLKCTLKSSFVLFVCFILRLFPTVFQSYRRLVS